LPRRHGPAAGVAPVAAFWRWRQSPPALAAERQTIRSFALIEAHRAASAALDAVIHEAGRNADDVVVRAGGGGRPISRMVRAGDMIEVIPTTIPGIIASRGYVEPMATDLCASSAQRERPADSSTREALEKLGGWPQCEYRG